MSARLSYAFILLIAAPVIASSQPLQDPVPLPELSGASTTKIPVTVPGGREVLEAETAASSSSSASIPLEQPIDPETYVCGAGDVFELNFWGQQNFRLRVAADLEGRTFISKVGFVGVAGLTLASVRKQILKRVARFYPGLNAEVTLVYPRSFQVHVVNNVSQPGSYRSNALERVSAVLNRAGGVTGSRRNIEITRRGGKTARADLVRYELTGDTAYNPFVLDGDVISVPFADVSVRITGAVRRPGRYELVEAKDLAELIELAGGLSTTATRSLPIRIIRRDAKERQVFIQVQFDRDGVPNRVLVDNDHVEVRGAEELDRGILLLGAVIGAESADPTTSTKRLLYIEGDTVGSLVQRAGGITSAGDLRRAYISRPREHAPPELIPVDLDSLLLRRDFTADKRVALGDTIVVPPMQYSVHVDGAVARSGAYAFNPTFGIAEYIARAGGRSRTARNLEEIKVIDVSGATRSFSPDTKPSPGDLILVPERNFSRSEVVQLIFAGAGLVLSGVAITLAATR